MEGQEGRPRLRAWRVHGASPLSLSLCGWLGLCKSVADCYSLLPMQPTCHANHLPPFLQKYDEFKAKGVDVIAVIAANDAFVLSGWARFLGLKDKVSSRTIQTLQGTSPIRNYTGHRALRPQRQVVGAARPLPGPLCGRLRHPHEALRPHYRRPQGQVRGCRDRTRRLCLGRRRRPGCALTGRAFLSRQIVDK